MTTITDEALDHLRKVMAERDGYKAGFNLKCAENEKLRAALEEVKLLVTVSNRNISSERLDRVERVCDEALAKTDEQGKS